MLEGYIAVPTDGREPLFSTFALTEEECVVIAEYRYSYEAWDIKSAMFEIREEDQ